MYGPDTSKSFDELATDVAVTCGLADYVDASGASTVAGLPTDPDDLNRVRKAINDAIALMALERTWNCLTIDYQITLDVEGDGISNVGGDPGRYLLPWYVVQQPGHHLWAWTNSDGYGGQAALGAIEMIQIARSKDQSLTGVPRLLAMTPHMAKEPADRNRLELWVWPNPDIAYTLEASIQLFPARLVHGTDKHVFGAIHDPTLVAGAIYLMHSVMEDVPPAVLDRYDRVWKERLAASMAKDNELAPKTVGLIRDPEVTMNRRPGRLHPPSLTEHRPL